MNWTRNQTIWTATGLRGRYYIRWHTGGYWLSGIGHDRLPMLDLGEPMPFPRLELAQEHAEKCDKVQVRESEVSGT